MVPMPIKRGYIVKNIIVLTVFTFGLMLSSQALAKVNIFACAPEWGALAEEIGGNKVSVTVATTASQDVHFVRAKPSLLAAMRKADLIFCSGASLEQGWLPLLVRKAGSADVQQEAIGWLMASDYIDKLDVMTHADRSMGHVHPEGNPHVHLDARNINIIAEMLAERLLLIDRDNMNAYQNNLARFRDKWAALLQKWESDTASLKGKNVVVYHNAWSYLLDWLDMNVIASLEPKPGVPPTAAHLESVLQGVKNKNVIGILVAPYENEEAAEWLSQKSGIPVLQLPFTVGANAKVTDLETLFEQTIMQLKGK